MTSYYRVILGKGHAFAAECFAGGFIGADYGIAQDLSNYLPDHWGRFNEKFIPIWLARNAGKTEVAARVSCRSLWTISKGIRKADLVLCPDGTGIFRVGEVVGDYYHIASGNLPHRRAVNWLDETINRSKLGHGLRGATGSIGAVANVSQYETEIKSLIAAEPNR